MSDGERHEYLETTLSALLLAIDEVAETQDDAFAVLETMLAEGRVALVADPAARRRGHFALVDASAGPAIELPTDADPAAVGASSTRRRTAGLVVSQRTPRSNRQAGMGARDA